MNMAITEIWKVYKEGSQEVIALKDVSLEIGSGEYAAITGPSGSGKSTLLHILGCLDIPTKGEYRLNGKRVERLEGKAIAKIRNNNIGFVFQFFNLLPRISAQQNVEIPLFYAGEKKDIREEKALKALQKVNMEHRTKHFPHELSGGEKQRVAIARAIVNNPDIIFADEPTGNLDSKTGATIMKLFDTLNKEGKTVIIVTHNLMIAQKTGKIISIQDGMIRSENTYT